MKSSKLLNKPKQYIKGWVEFYKLKFKVTPSVLIPRPETELLVDEVLKFLQTTNYKLITILDIGTGAGNIAISIAKNLYQHSKGVISNIIAIDISEKALKIAKQNAKLHGVLDKIEFVQSNLLDCRALQAYNDKNIVIVANLPYIPSYRVPYLDSSVKDFEPNIALDGGEDGFDLYRKLFQQISRLHPCWVINPRSGVKLIVGEIDYTHGELAKNEALKFFPESSVEIKTDLAHKQRILLVR